MLGIVLGSATANSVPETFASETNHGISANQLAPVECSGINLTNIVDLSQGNFPTAGNDLIIGTTGVDIVDGGNGNDCILGGGGDDQVCNTWGFLCAFLPQFFLDGLSGGNGNDVIIGGKGTDAAIGGGGTDTCYSEYRNSCE